MGSRESCHRRQRGSHRHNVRHFTVIMLRAGLIGLSSAGKTTLFNLLTRPDTGKSHPSGRSDAEEGLAHVPDTRLDRLTQIFHPKKTTPATVTFVDMPTRRGTGAGALVDLTQYRTADALLHIVRAFRDENVAHPEETINPARDVRRMEDELILADLAVAERRLERLEKDRKKGVLKDNELEIEVLKTCTSALSDGQSLRQTKLDKQAKKLLRGFQFLSAKPLLIVINVDEADVSISTQDSIRKLELDDFLVDPTVQALVVCAKIELEIAELGPQDAEAFIADLGLEGQGLVRVTQAAYELLGYISFFTAGDDECRAWSIPDGTVAKEAAGEIHTDLSRGFIRAEVVDYNDLVSRHSFSECRKHAELRLEGKDYVVRDGDVINVRFSV